MIFKQIATGTQMALRGWSCTTPSKVIKLPSIEDQIDFCLCDFQCDYKEFAFVYPLNEEDVYRNDYRSFLLNLLDVSSTYSFVLVSSSGLETPLIDNTYGELFDKGFNPSQPLKVGYRIDWLKVFTNLGGGLYSVKISQTDFGNTVETETHKFDVKQFSELLSNNTVKIETNQKGVVLNGEDYEGMTWNNMVRIRGKFGNEKPQYEENKLQDSNYIDYQVQKLKFNQYTLNTELIPSSIGDNLVDTDLMTDEILISNYDVFAYKQYRQLPVYFDTEIDNSDDYSRTSFKRFTVTFKDITTKVKRNFV